MTPRRSENDDAASLLVGAYRGRGLLDRLPPECRPRTVEDAYVIQDAIIEALGPVGGWKVGRAAGQEPRCAPVPAIRIFDTGATLDPASLPAIDIEVEFAFRVSEALPPRPAPYELEEVARSVELVPLIEAAGSRFVALDAVDPLEKLADLNANVAFIVGRALPDWRRIDFGRTSVTLSIDGHLAQSAMGPGPAGDPLELLLWQANHVAQRREGLKPGDVVTTGALQGGTAARAGARATGVWADWGLVEVALAAG